MVTQNPKPEKGCVLDKLSSPSSKENGSIVSSQDDRGTLSWYHKYVIVVHLAYGSHVLQKALGKCHASYTQPDSCLWL